VARFDEELPAAAGAELEAVERQQLGLEVAAGLLVSGDCGGGAAAGLEEEVVVVAVEGHAGLQVDVHRDDVNMTSFLRHVKCSEAPG
jgi:hypothetical protein